MKRKQAGYLLRIVLSALLAFLSVGCQKNSAAYAKYADWYVLKDYKLAMETTYEEAFDRLQVDTYRWYADIQDREGVYVVHTWFFSKALHEEWKEYGIYDNVANRDTWYFACSPNYLIDQGLQIPKELIEKANGGVRVYLLPASFSEEEFESVSAFLREDAGKNIQDGEELIPTVFNEKREIAFASYENGIPLFTWPKEKGEEAFTKEACILLCTPQNMKYFESESLCACMNLSSTYLKFKSEAVLNDCLNRMPENLVKQQLHFVSVASREKR